MERELTEQRKQGETWAAELVLLKEQAEARDACQAPGRAGEG